jgi:uncharacterized membrane protein
VTIDSPDRAPMPPAHPARPGHTAHRRTTRRGRWGQRLRWVFWRHLPFGGLAGALVFFVLALTPSLLPRVALLQGAICGISAVIGFGLGSLVSALLRRTRLREPSPRAKRAAWWVLGLATLVLVPTFLLLSRSWQEESRELMGMSGQAPWQTGVIVVVAVVLAYVILVLSRLVRALGRGLVSLIDRVLPRPVAVIAGLVATAVIVAGLVQGFVLDPTLNALNASFSVVNDGTSPGIEQPTSPTRSGSPESHVPWDTLGVKGRDFVGSGPSRAEIAAFTGRPARQPIRVYVGLGSASARDERVNLALRELDRTDAWSRDVLAVFTTTGTGWVDEKAADPLEYIHGGNTAEVALQYSYLPSWISFLVDTDEAADTGRELIDAVYDRWQGLPRDSRPRLLLYGESLGSFGTESAFSDFDDMVSKVDGALLVGPVFRNDIHNTLTDDRREGSPMWRPVYEQGREVRFVVSPPDLRRPAGPWADDRVVYLQNSSDPITYWAPDLLWSRPDWLDDPRGPDVSPTMFYMPVITFFQTAADLAFSTGVPAGHGHVYGANQVDSWLAVAPPEEWTAADTRRLRALIAQYE